MGKLKILVEPVLVLISLLCAFMGQSRLSHQETPFLGSVPWFLVAGISLVGLIVWRERLAVSQNFHWAVPHRLPYVFVGASALFSLLALALIVDQEKTGSNIYWGALALWSGSCLTYALAFSYPPRSWWRERWQAHRREILMVVGLTALAAGLRFLWLDRLPDVMNGDEGLHSLEARKILIGNMPAHPFSIFYGSGTLYLFFVAGLIKLLGPTVLASRLLPAIGGVLGVPATYLLARRLFGPSAAFVAAGFVTVLHSHIQFSRVIGVGYINATLFASLGVYLLYSALENHSLTRAALGGLVMGVWLYVYIDSRFVPMVLGLWCGLLLLLPRHRAFILENIKPLFAFAGGYVLAAAPLGLMAVRHWADFNQRFGDNGVFQQHYYVSRENLPQFIWEQWSHAFLSITHYPMVDFYQASLPLLDVFTGAVFWLALIYAGLHLFDRRYLLLNLWFWSGVTTIGLLTLPRSSDGYRLLIVFIPIVLMMGTVVDQIAQSLSRLRPDLPWIRESLSVAALATALVFNVNFYFFQFPQSCHYAGGDTSGYVGSMGRDAYFLGTLLAKMQPGDRAVYLGKEEGTLVYRYGTHASTEYLNPGVSVDSWTGPLTPELLTQPAPQAFILLAERQADLAALQSAYPGGQTREVDDCGTRILYVYSLPFAERVPVPTATPPAASAELIQGAVVIEGETVQVRYSPLDTGLIEQLFDHDDSTWIRSQEANPIVLEFTFPTLRQLTGLSIIIGGAEARITVELYPSLEASPITYSEVRQGTDAVPVSLDFDSSTFAQKLRLEVHDTREGQTHVHIWELTFR